MKEPGIYKEVSQSRDKVQLNIAIAKTTNGWKQVPSCRNERIIDIIITLGFQKSDADPCLINKKQGDGMLIFSLHVDDGLLAWETIF